MTVHKLFNYFANADYRPRIFSVTNLHPELAESMHSNTSMPVTSTGNPFANGLGKGAGAAASATGGVAVTNLGVVGRGKGRITLQPMAAGGSAPSAGSTAGAFAAASAAAGSTVEAPKKRSLEDVMGARRVRSLTLSLTLSQPPDLTRTGSKPRFSANAH